MSLSFQSCPKSQPRVGDVQSHAHPFSSRLSLQASIVQSWHRRNCDVAQLRMDGESSPNHPQPHCWKSPPLTLIMEDTTLSPPPPLPPPPHPPPPPSHPPVPAPHAPPTLPLMATTTPRYQMSHAQMRVRTSRVMGRYCTGRASSLAPRVPPPSPPKTASLILRGCSLSAPKDFDLRHKLCLLTPSLISSWVTSLWNAASTALRAPVGKSLSSSHGSEILALVFPSLIQLLQYPSHQSLQEGIYCLCH